MGNIPIVGGGGSGNTVTVGTFAALPVSAPFGSIYQCTDGPYTCIYEAGWKYFYLGYPVTPPATLSNWIVTNQGPATILSSGGYKSISYPGSTNAHNWVCLTRAVAAGSSVVVRFRPTVLQGDNNQCGMVLRDSVSGKLITWGLNWSGANLYTQIFTWNSPISFNAQVQGTLGTAAAIMFCLRVRDDGVNRYYELSSDNGMSWTCSRFEANSTFITADQVGFGISPYNGAQQSNLSTNPNVITAIGYELS